MLDLLVHDPDAMSRQPAMGCQRHIATGVIRDKGADYGTGAEGQSS